MSGLSEQAVLAWYDEMDGRPGFYEMEGEWGLRKRLFAPDAGLRERFVKRLCGNRVVLTFGRLPVIGDVGALIVDEFDIDALVENSMQTELPITSDMGFAGKAHISWEHNMVTFDVAGTESFHLRMEGFYNMGVVALGGTRLELHFHVYAEPMMDDERLSGEALPPADAIMTRRYVERVFEQFSGSGFGRNLKLKDVEDLTRVPASTLSNIKRNKRTIGNLTLSTFSQLSALGQLLELDEMMVNALRASGGEVSTTTTIEPTVETSLSEDVSERFIVFYEVTRSATGAYMAALPTKQFVAPFDPVLDALLSDNAEPL